MRKIVILASIFLAFFFLNKQETAAQIFDKPPSDGLFADDGILDKEPIPFPDIRRADVVWSKRIWREIDFRQKMNHAFYYPINSHNNWRSFINVIMDGIKENEFPAYELSATDELLVPLSYNEIMQNLEVGRTETFTDLDTGLEFDTLIVDKFDPTRVMRLRIKEDWYFDKQRSQMLVRINAFCPVMIVERNGEEATQPLFWISYEQARPYLAKAPVFNRGNAAERRSYDEVFWKRSFASYIYKEENVYDRTITDYTTGLDAMLESERVKMDIFKFEHDLWEY